MYDVKQLAQIRELDEQNKEYLRLIGNEGSWLKTISIESERLSPLFRMVPHVKEKMIDRDFLTFPVRYVVYKDKQNSTAFAKSHLVKVALEHFQFGGVDIVTALHASYDNPANPFITEGYFNPFFEEEGELNFLENIRVLSESAVHFFVNFQTKGKDEYEFKGLTFLEVPPEYLSNAKSIYETLLENKEKRQSAEEFLLAKQAFQQAVPLDRFSISWIGDPVPLVRVKEFL